MKADTKERPTVLHLCEGTPLVTGGSPHKDAVMWEVLLCYDITMFVLGCMVLYHVKWQYLQELSFVSFLKWWIIYCMQPSQI